MEGPAGAHRSAPIRWGDAGVDRSGRRTGGQHAQPRDGAAQRRHTRDPLCGYHEAIGVAAVSESEFYVGDLGGSIRYVNLDAGVDTELVHLGMGLTGIALAEL